MKRRTKNNLFIIVLTAFIFRLGLLFIDNFWFRLPQGGDDTERFNRWAMEMVLNGFPSFLELLSGGVTLFSSLGAVIYIVFGEKPMLWGFANVLFGVGTVYNVHRITFMITKHNKIANRAAWIVCLYPNFAILSALVLREAPIHFFLTLSVLYLLRFYNTKSVLSIVLFFFFSLIASILHSAVIMVYGGFAIGMILLNKQAGLFNKLFVVLFTLAGVYVINSTGIGLSKFGGSFESALESVESGMGGRGNAIYPSWLLMTGGLGDLWKIPIRMIAFLFAPLIPFMVKSANHLLGVLDATLYLYMFYHIIKKWKLITFIKSYAIILCMIICIVMGFSFGASNFGTNIRHRAKILPLITVLGVTASFANYKTKKEK